MSPHSLLLGYIRPFNAEPDQSSQCLSCARGRPSGRMFDHELPYKVIVCADGVGGKNRDFVIAFHTQIDATQRSRSVFNDDRWYQIYCFADPQHLRTFQAIFGGEQKD